MSQHRPVIRKIADNTGIRFSAASIAESLGISRHVVYRVLWRLQMIGAVRAHGRAWSKVRSRWIDVENLIESLEWIDKATPETRRLIDNGKINDARRLFRLE